MFFCGNYIEKVNKDIVPLKYNLNGERYSILCVEENEYITFIAICPPESEFEKEAQEFGNILWKETVEVYDTITLSNDFIRYLDGNDVTVLGCGDRIEIYKEGVLIKPLDEEEARKIADAVLKHLDELGL